MKNFIQKIKSFFSKPKGKKPWKVGLSNSGLKVYSLNPQTGEMRVETGLWYCEAYNDRAARREFKKKLEKVTGKKFKVVSKTA